MTATQDTAYKLFVESVLADEDRGYPADVEFVAADLPSAERIIWRNVHAGIPTAIVGDELEVLFVPRHLSPLSAWARLANYLRHRAPIDVRWREHGHEYSIPTYVTRRAPLGGLRRDLTTA